MRKYSVYIHTNKINGKRYIGVTKRKPEKRWRNGEGYKDQPHFYSAIQKYGWDNFDHFILEVDSDELMYQLEQQYIAYYKTTDRRYGYNKSIGGESGADQGKNSDSKEYGINHAKEYYETHKEEIDSYRKKYCEIHRKEKIQYLKQYHISHREELKNKRREYYNSHKEEIKNKQREYYLAHIDKKKEYDRSYHLLRKQKKEIPPITPLW